MSSGSDGRWEAPAVLPAAGRVRRRHSFLFSFRRPNWFLCAPDRTRAQRGGRQKAHDAVTSKTESARRLKQIAAAEDATAWAIIGWMIRPERVNDPKIWLEERLSQAPVQRATGRVGLWIGAGFWRNPPEAAAIMSFNHWASSILRRWRGRRSDNGEGFLLVDQVHADNVLHPAIAASASASASVKSNFAFGSGGVFGVSNNIVAWGYHVPRPGTAKPTAA